MLQIRHISKTPVALLTALAFLSACDVVVSDVSVLRSGADIQSADCKSDAGFYVLPKGHMKISVTQDYVVATGEKSGAPKLVLENVERLADREHVFCLDYQESVLSRDVFETYFSPNSEASLNVASPTARPPGDRRTGLLSLVVSKGQDRTGVVLQNLLRAFLIARTGDPRANLNRETTTAPRTEYSDSFDPLDLGSIAKVNHELARYRFCLTMGKYTIDPDKLSVSN